MENICDFNFPFSIFRFPLIRVPAFDHRAVVGVLQNLLNRLVNARMNEIRLKLGERNEHEAPLVKTRVRDGQKRRLVLQVAVEKQIQIDRPRRFFVFLLSAEQVFDANHPRHHLFGRDAGDASLGDHIQKQPVIFDADRLGFVNRRQARDLEIRFHHRAHAEQKISGAVAEIRAERDVGGYGFVLHVAVYFRSGINRTKQVCEKTGERSIKNYELRITDYELMNFHH